MVISLSLVFNIYLCVKSQKVFERLEILKKYLFFHDSGYENFI
mgnify:CR=1 FL=1